ncbi:MAG: biotin/lipoyl-binding carrier protein [Alphaproteobacteria bacterium]|jgi:biotin carboxyl carrier protein|nr:biotin/lipoyl-binding carrier protein [Alphaproteobacteria bacterium]
MQIKSEIAGSVWKVIAQEGAELAAEDVIVILESMKMEIPITAPKAGVCEKLHVREGEMIGEGQLVATLKL